MALRRGRDAAVAADRRRHRLRRLTRRRPFALDLATGAEKWRTVSPAGHLTAAQDTLLAVSGYRLIALRPASTPPQPARRTVFPAVDVGPAGPATTTNLYVNADHTGAVNLAEPRPPLRRAGRPRAAR